MSTPEETIPAGFKVTNNSMTSYSDGLNALQVERV